MENKVDPQFAFFAVVWNKLQGYSAKTFTLNLTLGPLQTPGLHLHYFLFS